MTQHRSFSDILQHPSLHYRTPKDVLEDLRLSAEEKRAVLDSWADEEAQRLSADNENMLPGKPGGARKEGDAAEMLSAITKARVKLD